MTDVSGVVADFYLRRVRELETALRELLDVLKEAEWGHGVRWTAYCDFCFNEPSEGHTAECRKGKAIADSEALLEPQGTRSRLSA